MKTHAAESNARSGWLKRLACSIGALAALFGGDTARGAPFQGTEGAEYRPANTVPPAWREFASRLQNRFQEQLASDDDVVRELQDYLGKRSAEPGGPAPAILVRAWILPGGEIERLDCDGLDGVSALALKSLLAGVDAGTPPADMLQPLHLRLSLRSKDQPQEER
jgi:hypothetical protein